MANLLELDISLIMSTEVSEMVRHTQTIDGRKCSQNMNLRGNKLALYREHQQKVKRAQLQLKADKTSRDDIMARYGEA